MAFGVSGSSGGRFGASSGGGSGWSPAGGTLLNPEDEKQKRHGVGGFALNLIDDVGSAVVGIPVGLGMAGKGFVSGIGNSVELVTGLGDGRDAFEKDKDDINDILGMIAKDYKDTYTKGGDHFQEKFYEHPLGPILDVLTVLSLLGGAAVKGAQLSGKAGTLGAGGAKILGLERAAVPAGMTAKEFVAREGARAGRKGYVSADGEAMIPRRRVVRTSAAQREGLSKEWASREGKSWERTSSANPAHRPREALADLLGEVFPNMPGLGADRRAGRQQAQRIQRESRRDAKKSGVDALEGALTNPSAKLGGMRAATDDPLVQHAAQNAARGVEAADRARQLGRDLADLPTLANSAEALKQEAATTATLVRKIAARHRLKGDDEAATHYDHLASELVGHEEDVAARARKAGRSTDPSDARKFQAHQQRKIAQAIRDRGPEAVVDDIKQRVYMAENASWIEPKMRAELEHQAKLVDPASLDARQTKLVNRLLASYRDISDANTARLREGGVEPRDGIEFQAQRVTGVPEDELRPAVKLPDRTERRQTGMGKSAQGLKNATKPSQARQSTGISYRTAQHMVDPRVIARSYRDAEKWLQARKTWDAMIQSAIHISDEGEVPRGYTVVDGNKVRAFASRVRDFLDDEAPAAFGDSPQLEQMQQLMLDGFAEKFGQGSIAVPKGVHGKLMGEIEQGNKALTSWIDKPTALWRTLTLTVRPAFYVNNLLGQTMLLLATQGVYKSIRTGIQFAKDAEVRNLVADASGATSMGGQLRFMSAETNRLLKNKSFAFQKARLAGRAAIDANDLAGRLGAAITDDPIRRMSMLSDLRPHVHELMDAKGISFKQALEELLDDPKVLEQAEEKVLGDLVDFSNLTQHERELVRRIVPFYSWLKGSSKRFGTMILEEPAKANVLTKLGAVGTEATEDELGGAVPGFVAGSAILSKSKDKEGSRAKTLVTGGWQPFSTPADVLGMFGALGKQGMPVGASNPISSVNPLIQIPIEGFTNRDSFSGDQLGSPDSTLGEKMLGSAALSTPLTSGPWNARQKLKDPEYNSHALYRASITNEVLKFLGVPVRDLNVDTALKVGGGERPLQLSADVPAAGETSWVRGPDGHMYAVEDRGNPEDWGASGGWSPAG